MKFCPVCSKVYRDSDTAPMVCCDHCGRWIHTQCDNVSDADYAQLSSTCHARYFCLDCRTASNSTEKFCFHPEAPLENPSSPVVILGNPSAELEHTALFSESSTAAEGPGAVAFLNATAGDGTKAQMCSYSRGGVLLTVGDSGMATVAVIGGEVTKGETPADHPR